MENKYESVIIIRGDLKDEEYKKAFNEIIDKIKNLIDIEKIEEVGLRNLAYQVRNNKTGYYVVIYYKATSQAISEIERFFRIKDEILKFLTVKKD